MSDLTNKDFDTFTHPQPPPMKTEDPKTEDPKSEDPKSEDPKSEDPKSEDPKSEDPKSEDPKPEDPKTEETHNEKAYSEDGAEVSEENIYDDPQEKYNLALQRINWRDMADDPILREQLFKHLYGSYGILDENIYKLTQKVVSALDLFSKVEEGVAENVNEGMQTLDEYAKQSQVEIQQVQQIVLSSMYQHLGDKFDAFVKTLQEKNNEAEKKADALDERILQSTKKLEDLSESVLGGAVSKAIRSTFLKIFTVIIGAQILTTVAIFGAKQFM